MVTKPGGQCLFLKKIIGGHKAFLWGHWYICFGLLVGDIYPGFQSQGKVSAMSVRMDSSGSPLVRHMRTF